ncbi:phosphotransferase family protein [Legionella anisa]|uniref:phosphotransferase family protein n=1 Tax=Legionella anisa TaxID=28082 RepID=UPI001041B8D3|nr:phosphotransferase [Legionella anisa]
MTLQQSHRNMINIIIEHHFEELPKKIRRSPIGICNEVYYVDLDSRSVIVRLSNAVKYLRGSEVHIPEFKALDIKVPDILASDYSKKIIPLCYQIQSKIQGKDLGVVIESLNQNQLSKLAGEIATIIRKVKTLPVTKQFGLIWGGDNDVSDSWSERMDLWIQESIMRGRSTGVMDQQIEQIASKLYTQYKSYFDRVEPIMYYGDMSSKNVMVHRGIFSGLVDLDGLTQGDPLEALGRIKLSWYGTSHGEFYFKALVKELDLTQTELQYVTVYALLNQCSWMCENGIQFNQNTKPVVDEEKIKRDKDIVLQLASELWS